MKKVNRKGCLKRMALRKLLTRWLKQNDYKG